ncbi:MAG: S8 family serine peptidase, partial [Kineosporiaceae bacterium]
MAPPASERGRSQDHGRSRLRWAAALGAGALTVLGVGAPAQAQPAGAAWPVPTTRVVVTGADVAATAAAVTAAGGQVTAAYPLIGGVAATLPANAHLPAGYLVVPDREVRFAATQTATTEAVSTVRATVGLPADPGDVGRGVTVAVVDTGVADVPDLDGRVVAHLDVTGGGGGDGEGHGTFMAGLVAGTGAASGGAYAGVAPGARILDVKVARA